MDAISPTRLAALDHPRARWSMSASASTGEAVAVAGAPPLPSGPADVAVEESQASIIVKKRTSSRRSSSAPPEESSSARLVRQLDMNDLLREDDDAAADSPSLDSQDQAGQAAAAGQPQDSKASAKPASAANDKTQRRRSTRTAKDKQRKDASDSGVNEDEEEKPLLPPTTTLLFTTSPPTTMAIFQAPPLPITLQTLIEVPDFRLLNEGELPMGRLRIQPNSGQQTDFSDEYYLKRHAQGEALERKGRKQERDRLVIERNRIKHRVEQLKLEVASASFYANPSPIKPPPPSFVGNIGSSSSTSSPFTAAVGGSRHSTPVVSERMRESERNKRRQLQEAEETLRRYDELLQPREPYVPFSADAANGTAGNANTAPRTWLTGGKGIPPPPDGVQPSDFLNAPRGAALASAKQAQQAQQLQGRGSSIVAQRRLAHADSGNAPFSSGTTNNASGTSSGRVTRSRPSSPAVYAAPVSYANIAPAPVASSSGTANNNNINTSPQRFVPILPRPSTSGSFMPPERRGATTVSAAGPSSLTLKIRQSVPPNQNHSTYQPNPSTSNAYASDGALASRRRTRALQPIDISLSREDNYSAHNGAGNTSLKRTASDASQMHTGQWDPIGTGRIRPYKKRRRRRRKGESSEDDDGALEAELEMEASREFMDDLPEKSAYIHNLKSSYASAFEHNSPLGSPDDPDDADNETPRTAATASSGRGSLSLDRRRNSNISKAQRSQSKGVPQSSLAVFKHPNNGNTFDDTTDFSDSGLLPPPPAPPLLPSIHIDRASSASLSTDDVSRRGPRQTTVRSSTPSGSGAAFKNRRPPRHLFHRPDKPVEALLERARFLTPDGRKGSPLPGKSSHGSSSLALTVPPPLSAIEKAALTFESEGDLSSLPSDTDDGGETSEFHDSESRFKSERALWRLETSDTVAPAFLGSKGASHGSTPLATSVLPGGDDPSSVTQLETDTMLGPILAAVPKRRGRPPKNAASSTPEPSKIPSQVTVGGLKTRKRPKLDDYPVNDLNEISESQMTELRDSYQHVAARKKEMMGINFLEMPIGDWQVYTPESDIRHT